MSRVIAIRQGQPRAVVMAGLRGQAGEQGEQGTPFQVDASGLLANRGAFDAEPEGFAYLATDTGDLYFRQGAAGNWSDPVPFQGPVGDSAYQVAVANGFVGTEAEWLASLAGADGVDGVDGLSITGAAIDGNGHLLLTLSNSTVLDAGYVVGPAGANGTNGTNGTNGADGVDGEDGEDGRGIASMAIDGSNHLIITYTDTTTEDAGLIPGAGGSAVWGGIGGTLADQTDLQSALESKAQVGSGDPQPLGTATPGVSTSASRQDHVHDMPSAADVGAIPVAEKGVADGVAPLDSGGKVAAAYLPSFVDDVLEFGNLAAFPTTGESGKIYVALDSNKTYRWGGSSYIEISPSPGSTDAVAEGVTNLYHTAARVLATVLSGLSLATGTAITSSDSVLVAFGKLQKQITDLIAAVSGKQDTLVSGTSIKTINGESVLGGGNISVGGGGGGSTDWGDIGGTLSDQADLQAAIDARALIDGLPSRTVTASGAVTPADAGHWLICDSATPITLTIGAEATAAWAVSGILPMFHILQIGAGAVTVTGDGFSVTTHVLDSNVLDGTGAAATALRRSSNTWSLIGRLVAA